MSVPYTVRTKKGYDMYEVTSALQKTIRRGLEKEALYWAMELNSDYHANLWNRLVIIAYEDVGAANTSIIPFVGQCREDYYLFKGKQLLPLVAAVITLCRSPKSRLFDWAVNYVLANHDRIHPEIPDVALDKHTRRGKRMGRGGEHFWQEGSIVHPHAVQPEEEFYKQTSWDLWTNPPDKEKETPPAETPRSRQRTVVAVPDDEGEDQPDTQPVVDIPATRVRTRRVATSTPSDTPDLF